MKDAVRVFCFLEKSKDTNDEEYFAKSFFPMDRIDYAKYQTKYTLLYKEKVNVQTGESIVLFCRDSYKNKMLGEK